MQTAGITLPISAAIPKWPVELEPAWLEAPRERTMAWHPILIRVSRVLQLQLREFADSIWHAADHAVDVTFTTGVLAWISSDPARRTPVGEFTYEVLSAPLMDKFFVSVARRLPARLQRLAAELNARGRRDLAAPYVTRRTAKIVEGLRHNRRVVNRLIAGEEALMRELLRYAGTSQATALPAAGERLRQSWMRTLKRMLPGCDLSACAAALFSAVTGELEQALADFKAAKSLRAADRNRCAAFEDTQCCPDATPAPSDDQSAHPRSEAGECACTPENC